jgi:hypothetical protein
MNLYLILRPGLTNWDEYEGAVVAAEGEEAARNIHPDGELDEPLSEKFRLSTWVPVEEVKVKLLGVAVEGVEEGVILASFNAG